MRIAVVDDEQNWRTETDHVLQGIISQQDSIELFESGECFLESKHHFDVVLMDIEMPGRNGFSVINDYKENDSEAFIIILTTHMESARQGYLYNAFRYIDKTKMEEELEEAFGKIRPLLEKRNYLLLGKRNGALYEIPLSEILFIETKSKGVIIHTFQEYYYSDKKINELEEQLADVDFFRCHKSFLINLNGANKVDKNFAYFPGDKKAYISVRKETETRKRYIASKKKYASK